MTTNPTHTELLVEASLLLSHLGKLLRNLNGLVKSEGMDKFANAADDLAQRIRDALKEEP